MLELPRVILRSAILMLVGASLYAFAYPHPVVNVADLSVSESAGEVDNAALFDGSLQKRWKQRRENRQAPQPKPEQPAPNEDGRRTEPVDPNAPPQFDAPPDDSTTIAAELTPEQKELLIQAIISFITALFAVFAGNAAQPFIPKAGLLLKNALGSASEKKKEEVRALVAAELAKVVKRRAPARKAKSK
jgi:hypothetical protein